MSGVSMAVLLVWSDVVFSGYGNKSYSPLRMAWKNL
jgi:hypothetical protein